MSRAASRTYSFELKIMTLTLKRPPSDLSNSSFKEVNLPLVKAVRAAEDELYGKSSAARVIAKPLGFRGEMAPFPNESGLRK